MMFYNVGFGFYCGLVLWKQEKRRMERRQERRDQQRHTLCGRTRFHACPFGKQVAVGADDGDRMESIYATAAGSESDEEEEEEEQQRDAFADNEAEGREESPELPFLEAPNLQALFFPSRCLVPPELLATLKDRYPFLGEEDRYMVDKKDWTAVFYAEDHPMPELPAPDAPYTETEDPWAGEEDDEDEEGEWG
ncbi:unnamed protein product [Closterium sp. NIES-65]|nr:unnamed protein product [Closterium sp. NIES-65]